MKPDSSVNIMIGGEAGQGLVTVGTMVTRALVRSGYEVVVTQDYMSRIRGGHNTFVVRFSPEPIQAPREGIDILVALNQETINLHKGNLTDRGIVIADSSYDTGDLKAYNVPFEDLASKKIYYNTVALGVLASTICSDTDILKKLLEDTFKKKGEEVIKDNQEVLQKSMEWQKGEGDIFECPAPPEGSGDRMTMNGNEAIAMGALAAGCNFCSFYPMTPSTSIALNLISKGKELGLIAEQAEDELAALNMALGASFAGGKAMVTTSGGGFALMQEAVSLAGMTETPVVVAVVQRPGPATGLPTRTEQGDLLFVLHSGHGEFPRAVFAPGSIDECFHHSYKAFDLAEKYQGPVFILSDQYLADSYRAVEPFPLDDLPEVAEPLTEVDNPEKYTRYELKENGVSPRLIPGFSKALVGADSDEHTPDGHITEDHEVRVSMVDKRNKKGEGFFSEIVPPTYSGSENPEILLVNWGTSRGPVQEAADQLSEERSVATLHFSQVWPMNPDHFIEKMENAGKVLCVEGNSTGQFAGLIRKETGFAVDELILRYDGLPFTPSYIIENVKNILEGT